MLNGLGSYLEVLGKNLVPSSFRCLAKFVPYAWRTEIFVSLMIVSQGLLLLSRVSCSPLPHSTLYLQSQLWIILLTSEPPQSPNLLYQVEPSLF